MKKLICILTAALIMSAAFSNGLKDGAEKYGFKMGAGISHDTAMNVDVLDVLETDFNSITATNEFKAYSLVNRVLSANSKDGMPVNDYSKADKMCMAAEMIGCQIRGHVLVWDAYMPDWFFRKNYDPKAAFVDKKTMCRRLEHYIDDVITHFETEYPGLIYCWDVVNEAVADSYNEAASGDSARIRKTRGGNTNLFYEVIGRDYVQLAFKYARNTVNRLGADIKLYYNDYNTYQYGKKEAIKNLIVELNSEEKLCDGVGMQGYIGGYGSQNGCMNSNDIRSIKTAILDYASLGVEVQITEMAVRNYQSDSATTKLHASFYQSLFDMLKTINTEESKPLTAVTIWGLCDDPYLPKTNYSYKMNGPYCGLYDNDWKPKESYKRVMKSLK